MSFRWTLAAIVAGLLILGLVVPLVLSRQGPPGPPFVSAGPLAQVDPRSDGLLEVSGRPVLVVRGGGVLRAFTDPPQGARFCGPSRRIEGPGGAAWSLEGRRLAGAGESLVGIPVQVHEGELYVDLTDPRPRPSPRDADVEPSCA